MKWTLDPKWCGCFVLSFQGVLTQHQLICVFLEKKNLKRDFFGFLTAIDLYKTRFYKRDSWVPDTSEVLTKLPVWQDIPKVSLLTKSSKFLLNYSTFYPFKNY